MTVCMLWLLRELIVVVYRLLRLGLGYNCSESLTKHIGLRTGISHLFLLILDGTHSPLTIVQQQVQVQLLVRGLYENTATMCFTYKKGNDRRPCNDNRTCKFCLGLR